ncbi:MAG: DUF6544 family protein [Candidatus Saccharibacteria bacterium]
MDKVFLPALLALTAILGLLYLIYRSKEVQGKYKNEVVRGLAGSRDDQPTVLTLEDIQHLPHPVQKYIEYTGMLGKPPVKNWRIVLEGQFKMAPEKDWSTIRIEQYNFFDDDPRRLSLNRLIIGIPVVGLDSYINGIGTMLIKVGGLYTVADAKGPEMNQSAAVMFLNDACNSAPAALIDQRFRWEQIDDLKVKAIFDDGRNCVSAVLQFNDNGELVQFTTLDKYYSPTGATYEKMGWSSVNKDYREINGLTLASNAEGLWHFSDGDYCYARITLKEVEYNCKTFKQ